MISANEMLIIFYMMLFLKFFLLEVFPFLFLIMLDMTWDDASSSKGC